MPNPLNVGILIATPKERREIIKSIIIPIRYPKKNRTLPTINVRVNKMT